MDKDRLDDWDEERAKRLLFDVARPSATDCLAVRVLRRVERARCWVVAFVSFAVALGVSTYFALTWQD